MLSFEPVYPIFSGRNIAAIDKDKDTCFWSLNCIVHYTRLNRKTIVITMNEIEESGIITHHKTGRGNGNYYRWHRDVAEQYCEQYRREKKIANEIDQAEMEVMGERAKAALMKSYLDVEDGQIDTSKTFAVEEDLEV